MKDSLSMLPVTLVACLILLFLTCALAPVSAANGAVINVPGDYSNIQAAINSATNGDMIIAAPGTYHESIDFLGKGITLRSSGGPFVTVIDGSSTSGSVVQCINGEGSDTVLEGFTITGGNAEVGGGMLNIGSSPTVIDCFFSGNHAGDRGGGMYNRQGSPTVIATTFEGNSAVEMGGGMFNIRATPTVKECLFTQNSANKGAGMRNYQNSHAIVTDTTFSYNHAGEEGGGMDNRKNSNAVVTGCVFLGNTAGSGGGGMHNYVGRAKSTGNPLIVNCLFVGNSAPVGAGMRNNDPDPTIVNSTVAFNVGSGISSRNGSSPTIENSVVWGNSGGSFSGASSGSSTVGFSDIEGGFPGPNLNVDPVFASPAGADGDPTTLDDNDYRLAAGSPLVDAGNNNAPALPATDLDGNPRIAGGRVDIGAYESGSSCSIDEGPDADDDGFTICGGDCDDNEPNIHPAALEVCDTIDNNCSGAIDEGFDADNDGYTSCSGDCDDNASGVHPSAFEICFDTVDNDCDGWVDEADSDCSGDPLLPKGAPCNQNGECESNKCKGKSGNQTCK